MPITRQTKSNVEIQEEQTITTSNMETKEANFKSIVRKLAYFNRSTSEALENRSDKINRQYTLLKDKLDEAYDLMQAIHGIKIDAEESDEAIDQRTRERKDELQPYENAIERPDEKKTNMRRMNARNKP